MGICVLDVENQNFFQDQPALAIPGIAIPNRVRQTGFLRWSPDSRALAFAYAGGVESQGIFIDTLRIVSVSDEGTQITHHMNVGGVDQLEWANDEQMIVEYRNQLSYLDLESEELTQNPIPDEVIGPIITAFPSLAMPTKLAIFSRDHSFYIRDIENDLSYVRYSLALEDNFYVSEMFWR